MPVDVLQDVTIVNCIPSDEQKEDNTNKTGPKFADVEIDKVDSCPPILYEETKFSDEFYEEKPISESDCPKLSVHFEETIADMGDKPITSQCDDLLEIFEESEMKTLMSNESLPASKVQRMEKRARKMERSICKWYLKFC